MSAASGITVSNELADAFSSAVTSSDVRFLKVVIKNESLVPDVTISASGDTLEDDLAKLPPALQDDVPAYILARTGGSDSSWVAISYVPDSAKVRDKMLYASTRNALTKSLGSTHFTDALFATTKNDLTVEAYVAHKKHNAAPKPMSEAEKERAEADRQANGASYEGSRVRKSHVNEGVGLKWSDDAIAAVTDLGQSTTNQLAILTIDSSEMLRVHTSTAVGTADLAKSLPATDPSYIFYAWTTPSSERQVVFIYSCPSSCPVKPRMVYSSGAGTTFHSAKSLLADAPNKLASRRLETSDPKEVDEAFLIDGLGLKEVLAEQSAATPTARTRLGEDTRAFARPKGPGRKR